MAKTYDPRDWYWHVNGDLTQAYHSARNAYVPSTDAGFAAFTADGTLATRIDSEASLADVLAKYGLPFLAAKPAVTFDDDPIKRALFEVMFNHENRIRTLAGQAQVTRVQFLIAIRSLLP